MENEISRLDAIRAKLVEFNHDKLGPHILMAARKLKKSTMQNLKEYNIGYEQLQVLYIIFISDNLKLADLARILDKDKSTISRCVNSLKVKNYISFSYDNDDNRKCVLNISDKGLDFISNIDNKFRNICANMDVKISKEEIAIVKDVLERLMKMWEA